MFFLIIAGKPTGKRFLVRPRCRWEDNITMELKELYVDTINRLKKGLLESPYIYGIEPPGSISHEVS